MSVNLIAARGRIDRLAAEWPKEGVGTADQMGEAGRILNALKGCESPEAQEMDQELRRLVNTNTTEEVSDVRDSE